MSLYDDAKKLEGKRILVVGDVMIDRDVITKPKGMSPEAPVPVTLYLREEDFLGGAANVANNVRSLSGKATLCGVTGSDLDGKLFKSLAGGYGIANGGIFKDRNRCTTLKIRYITSDEDRLPQHVHRHDRENEFPLSNALNKKVLDYVSRIIDRVDVIALSDYAKGVFSEYLAQGIIKIAKKKNVPVVVAPKPKNAHYFRGADVIIPNRREAAEIAADGSLEHTARDIARKMGCSDVIITSGKDGMYWYSQRRKMRHYPVTQRQLVNIVGAGDTVLAACALGIAAGLDYDRTIRLANVVAGVKITKHGTAAVTLEEVLEEIKRQNL